MPKVKIYKKWYPTEKDSKFIRFVCLSDTHNKLDRIAVPEGDILIHAGDYTNKNTLDEIIKFADDMAKLPHKYKIIVPGNHDLKNDICYTNELIERIPNCFFLYDNTITINGIKIYGTPALRDQTFTLPDRMDVLITHSPPYGILDISRKKLNGEHGGNPDLTTQLDELKYKPKVHVFGHIHEGYGYNKINNVMYINAANCNLYHRPNNKPIIFDLKI